MPLYGTPQAGSNPSPGLNLSSLSPGNQITLLAATDTVVTGSKSIAFALGFHDAAGYAITFNLSGCPNGSVVVIQVAGADIDGSYYTIATSAVDENGNWAYTDSGASPFRRAIVSSFAAGDVPVLTVTR